MNIIIYSQKNCQPCEALKADYRKKNIPFTEIVIGVDISKEDFFALFPSVRSVPHVVTE